MRSELPAATDTTSRRRRRARSKRKTSEKAGAPQEVEEQRAQVPVASEMLVDEEVVAAGDQAAVSAASVAPSARRFEEDGKFSFRLDGTRLHGTLCGDGRDSRSSKSGNSKVAFCVVRQTEMEIVEVEAFIKDRKRK